MVEPRMDQLIAADGTRVVLRDPRCVRCGGVLEYGVEVDEYRLFGLALATRVSVCSWEHCVG
jgi:hypothetical protein